MERKVVFKTQKNEIPVILNDRLKVFQVPVSHSELIGKTVAECTEMIDNLIDVDFGDTK